MISTSVRGYERVSLARLKAEQPVNRPNGSKIYMIAINKKSPTDDDYSYDTCSMHE